MKPIRNPQLAFFLLSRRLELGLTQKEVAEKADICFCGFYGRMEREGFLPKQRHKKIKLANALGVKSEALIALEGATNKEIAAIRFLEPLLSSVLAGKSVDDLVFISTIQQHFTKPLPPDLTNEILKHHHSCLA